MPGRLLLALLLALACHALILRVTLPERTPPQIGAERAISLQLTTVPPPEADDTAGSAPAPEPLPAPPEEPMPPDLPDVVPQQPPPQETMGKPLPEPIPQPKQLLSKAQVKRLLPNPPDEPVPAPQPARQPARPDFKPVEQVPVQQPPSAKPAVARVIPAEKASPPAITQAKPAYRSNPKPVYPELARRRSWQGTVVLNVTVESDGRPLQVEIDTTSGYPLLDTAALQAVRSWRFHPGTENGRPITMTVLIPIDFRLE